MSRGSIAGGFLRRGMGAALFVLVSACAAPAPDDEAAMVESPKLAAPPPPEAARTVDEFDTTTESQRAAAAEAVGGVFLGTTVGSLGDPTRAGFWIETPLVAARGTGRIVYPVTGKSAEVELIPAAVGGSRVSLAALRLLEAPLTHLPVLEVYAN